MCYACQIQKALNDVAAIIVLMGRDAKSVAKTGKLPAKEQYAENYLEECLDVKRKLESENEVINNLPKSILKNLRDVIDERLAACSE